MTKRRWTILLAAILLGGGLLWVLFDRVPIREGRCRLIRRKTDLNSPLMWLTDRFIRPLEVKPDDVRDLPAGFERPRYYTIKSADRPILAAADFSQKLVRLCVDTDGDGVLSEERCFTARVSEETPVSGRRQQLGPISLISRDDAGRANDGFYVNCFREDARGLLIPFAVFFRTGRLRLAGQTYRVAAVDGDYDGLFNSILPLPLDHRALARPGCDVFAIDLNHNGAFEVSSRQESEVFPLGSLVKVRDIYYAIDIASNGSSLALSRTEPQFGTLTVEPNDATVELKLWSDAADQHLLQNRERQLPAGKYAAIRAVLTTRDASGELWTFSSSPGWHFSDLGQLEHFEIRPGETTSIRIGPPFIVKAGIHRWSSGRMLISPVIVGCAGEEYAGVLRQGQTRPSPIAFKIVDEKGTVLIADTFQYG